MRLELLVIRAGSYCVRGKRTVVGAPNIINALFGINWKGIEPLVLVYKKIRSGRFARNTEDISKDSSSRLAGSRPGCWPIIIS